MIRHLVMLRTDTMLTVDPALDELRGLAGNVDGLHSIQVVKDTSGKARGFEWMAVMDFEDQAARDAWKTHPAHGPIHDAVGDDVEVLIFDYELDHA